MFDGNGKKFASLEKTAKFAARPGRQAHFAAKQPCNDFPGNWTGTSSERVTILCQRKHKGAHSWKLTQGKLLAGKGPMKLRTTRRYLAKHDPQKGAGTISTTTLF